jgi:phosphatidylserine decarboxylase
MKELPKEYVYDEADLPPGLGWNMGEIIRSLREGQPPESFSRFFDRDPDRSVPARNDAIVSPADGILEIERGGAATRFVVRMRFTDVHVQRVPLSGTVVEVLQSGEGFYDPQDEKYLDCVKKITRVESVLGTYEVRQLTALLTRRVETFLKPGESVRTGQRLGRILLGSTVILTVPGAMEIMAPSGSKVRAGETILASFKAPALRTPPR